MLHLRANLQKQQPCFRNQKRTQRTHKMVRKHFDHSYTLSEPDNSITRRKHISASDHYAKKEFLHDVAPAVSTQVRSNSRETKFSRGFFRKPQTLIQQDRERKELEKVKEQRTAARNTSSATNYQPPRNPLLGDSDKQPKPTVRVFENKFKQHEQPDHKPSIRVSYQKKDYENTSKLIKNVHSYE